MSGNGGKKGDNSDQSSEDADKLNTYILLTVLTRMLQKKDTS